MAAKDVRFSTDARDKMLRGVEILAVERFEESRHDTSGTRAVLLLGAWLARS